MPPEEMPVSLSSPAEEFRAGVLAELPLLLGVVPFGLIYGVLGLAAGLPGWAVVAMCSVLFAGSSQIVFAQLWGAQAPVLVIGATVGVVNLRHALYSASVAPYLRELSLRWKLLLAYLLTDEAYAAAIGRRVGPVGQRTAAQAVDHRGGGRGHGLLRYVPPAVLSALIAPEILLRHGALDPSPANPRLWAGVVAVLVALFTRNVLATIAAGMAALWLVQHSL